MNVDYTWIKAQLDGSKTRQDLSTSVIRLLDVVETMRTNDDELREILEKFHKLALGHSIAPVDPAERWVQVLPGEYSVGDTVRVHNDAYTGEWAVKHNGKRGRVAGVRGARVIVIYEDARDSEDQHYHDPSKLDRLA